MSGAEKIPAFDRVRTDLRYFNQTPFATYSPAQPPAPVSQVSHPFIAHIYPWVTDSEHSNRGLNHFPSPISPTNSAAALVALAASGYVDKNLPSNILRNFQKHSFHNKIDLKTGVGNEHLLSGEDPPKKKIRHQFDAASLSAPSNNHVTSFPEQQTSGHSGFAPFSSTPLHSAWQQFLFRFKNLDNFFDSSANRPDFLANFGNARNFSDSGFQNAALPETGRFGNFPTTSSSLVRTPSDDTMPSVNDVESDVFVSEKSELTKSSSRNILNSENHPDQIATKKSTSSALVDDNVASNTSFSNMRGDRKVLTNQVEANEMPGADSPVLTNRSLSSSSDQSRDGQQRRRRKRRTSLNDACPVCGITVRPCDLQIHLMQEIENISRLRCETRKKLSGDSLSNKRHKSLTSGSSSWSNSKKIMEVHNSSDRNNRIKTYQKVRSNRLDRLNKRVGQCLRTQPEACVPNACDSPGGTSSSSPWSTHVNLPANCPVCCSRLMGSQSAMHEHISRCLRLINVRQQVEDKQVEVDVEVDDTAAGRAYNELPASSSTDNNWSKQMQTYMNTSSLVSGAALFVKQQRVLDAEAEQDLNVDEDDALTFGTSQYMEEDLVREKSCDRDEPNSTDASKRLLSNDSEASSSGNEVSVLRNKIDKLEDETRSTRCMICMETYKNPVTSVQCWHVHCEKCWLQVLALKKLCPQCNAITPPSKLRRIYL